MPTRLGESQDHSSPTWTAYRSCVPDLGATCPMLQLDSAPMQEPGAGALIADDEAALAAERPDVVLLDVHLGGERTHDLLANMRGDGIPVVLVTGSVEI